MRYLILLLVTLAACASDDTQTISSMNYAYERVSAQCAYEAIRDEEGYAVSGTLRRDGNGQRFTALFNEDMPVEVIVRPTGDSASEVSTFVRLAADANPLQLREANYAVRQADELIYQACTEDSKLGPPDETIILTPQTGSSAEDQPE